MQRSSFLLYVTIMSRNSNGIRTHNHLVRKRTLNHLVKLAMFDLFI